MFKTQAEALDFWQAFLPQVEKTPPQRGIALCVPFTAVPALSEKAAGSRVKLGSQNIHWEDSGAFTGEISGTMLCEFNITYAVVGHSERRQYFGETDETVNKRLQAAQKHGIVPILCVGETEAQRQAGDTESHIFAQLEKDLVGIDQSKLVVAYEPIWAIGTGNTCEAKEADRVIGLIRSKLTNTDVPILYGGSVKPGNIDEIMAKPEIDGALVGGASLEPDSFARIVNYE